MGRKALLIPVVAAVTAALVVAGLYLFTPTLGREKPKIAVVKVEGTIENFQTSHKVVGLARDNSVEAVVLEINSPGGYVSPSFQLETAISELSRRKPTVAVVGQLGASGAYLAASAVGENNLYVHHSSLVGSTGVMAVWVSLENYYQQEGIEHYVFQTGEHKDMFAPWRPPTENEKKMIRNQIYEIKHRMIATIARNRPSLENNMPRSVVAGETVRGFRAVEMNLADSILLTNQAAVRKAAEAAGLSEDEYKVVEAGSLVR